MAKVHKLVKDMNSKEYFSMAKKLKELLFGKKKRINMNIQEPSKIINLKEVEHLPQKKENILDSLKMVSKVEKENFSIITIDSMMDFSQMMFEMETE